MKVPLKPPLSPQDRQAAHRIAFLCAAIAMSFGNRANLRLAHLFVAVASSPQGRLTPVQAEERLGVPSDTAYLDLLALGSQRERGGEGLGLLDERRDALGRGTMEYDLSTKGAQVLAGLAAALE